MKLRLILAASLALAPLPALACVGSIIADATRSVVCTGVDACRTVLNSQLRPGATALKAEELRASMQSFLDTRNLLDWFPNEDPAKAADPGLPGFFWSDILGNPTLGNALITTHVTARACVITEAFWDATNSRFVLTIERAD